MIIAKDKVVSLTYELRIDGEKGDVIESLTNDSPLTFLFGAGNLLPKFEENIAGLKVGDRFDFNLNAVEAYGEINNDAIVNVPIAAFSVNGSIDQDMLRLGNRIPMQDSAGNKLTGIVKEVTDEAVKMDFNHPLAGSHLFFNGEITDIREATDEEITHGHIHSESSCGCGGGCSCDDSSSCGDGCSDGHCC
jgi:FKBP-type peptidyl-prolyl cis-trans isomerase SlyD